MTSWVLRRMSAGSRSGAALWSARLAGLVRVAVYVAGFLIIAVAAVTYLGELELGRTFSWMRRVFGAGFVVIFTALLASGVFAAMQIHRSANPQFWYESGLQAASGIATLALTFTLLGISLGIGSLADKTVGPDTIQGIIAELTRHFSTALMTTVVGLPAAQALRALVSLRWVSASSGKEVLS